MNPNGSKVPPTIYVHQMQITSMHDRILKSVYVRHIHTTSFYQQQRLQLSSVEVLSSLIAN